MTGAAARGYSHAYREVKAACRSSRKCIEVWFVSNIKFRLPVYGKTAKTIEYNEDYFLIVLLY
jgi:hypothetical protein